MNDFTEELRDVLSRASEQVEQVNRQNGWFDANRTVLEGHMLIVTEVAEMSEAWRETGLDDATVNFAKHRIDLTTFICGLCGEQAVGMDSNRECPGSLPKPEGYGSEAADILIRLLDQCTRDGVDLAFEFTRKVAYNATRGKYHGGKKL